MVSRLESPIRPLHWSQIRQDRVTAASPPEVDGLASELHMTLPRLGVVIVTFNSADVILDCLESLLAASGVVLTIVVVDNASPDGSPDLIRAWGAGKELATAKDLPFPPFRSPKPVSMESVPSGISSGHEITLIEAGVNGGFAAGVNCGLAALAACSAIDRFWVLNPDSAVPPSTPRAFAEAEVGEFSLMGGRLVYLDRPDMIQIDGGLVNWITGVTGNMNQYANAKMTLPPDPHVLDFVTGASMVVSRDFYDSVGPMAEDYFLYYEEVDWAMRRGDLPLVYCDDAIVYHRAGTAIGSAALGRPASPFSLYFKHRARLMFIRRYRPRSVLTAQAYSLAKAAQLYLKGFRAEPRAVLAGSFGRSPPAVVRERLSPEAAERVFGKVSLR